MTKFSIFIFQFSKKANESGQILVIMLLIMVVGLSIGLFLLGRTTTDISLTTKITDSSRAFNAAEAGIEEALRSIGTVTRSTPVPFASGLTYTVNTAPLGSGGTIYPSSLQDPIGLGDAFSVWLVGHDDTTGAIDWNTEYSGSTINVCFASPSTTPAIGVTVYYRDSGGRYQSASNGFDPLTNGRTTHFLSAGGAGGTCSGYRYQVSVNFGAGGTFGTNLTGANATLAVLRIRPLFVAAPIAVFPPSGVNLVKQGNFISSTGNAIETTRKIEVDSPYKVPAPFMDFVLYSTGNGAALRK